MVVRAGSTRAAIAIWSGRRTRSVGDHGYAIYLGVMLALVCVAPAMRVLWLAASFEAALAVLSGPLVSMFVATTAMALWIGALFAGRVRGPAIRPPMLTYALARSGVPRVRAFGGSVARAGVVVMAALTLPAAFVGAVLVGNGVIGVGAAAARVVVAALVGVIATVAWLAGQAVPRAALAMGSGLAILVGVLLAAAGIASFTPFGWIAGAWSGGSLASLCALLALAVAAVASAPTLLTRLDTYALEAQAAQWESSTVRAYGMDFNAATAMYQGRPTLGRRIRAVRPTGLMARTFFVRDAIGAARTPGRLVIGVGTLAAASVLIALASAAGLFGGAGMSGAGTLGLVAVLGVVGAVLAFAGLGPLTDGLRHAASVASDLPLYGVSDARLLALHVLFPALVGFLVLAVGAAVTALLLGAAPLAPGFSAAVIGLLALLSRVNNAVKGPLSIALLTPIPTPVGDLSGAVRFVWSLDGVLLVSVAGGAVALAGQAVSGAAGLVVLAGTSAIMLATAALRWSRRREA